MSRHFQARVVTQREVSEREDDLWRTGGARWLEGLGDV
jgi:hypothetical protein